MHVWTRVKNPATYNIGFLNEITGPVYQSYRPVNREGWFARFGPGAVTGLLCYQAGQVDRLLR